MEKFNSERIEKLKLQFYKIMGQLEIEKNIFIPDSQLQIFEKELNQCNSEVEASGFILGSIRRYKIKLEQGRAELAPQLSVDSDTLPKDNLRIETDTLLVNKESLSKNESQAYIQEGAIIQQHDLDETVADERPVDETVVDEIPVDERVVGVRPTDETAVSVRMSSVFGTHVLLLASFFYTSILI